MGTSVAAFDAQKALDYISELLPELAAFKLTEPQGDDNPVQPTIGAEAACLLDVLMRSNKPQRILEIGTSYGFGTCVLGQAAATYGGKVISFEINERLAEIARTNADELGLGNTVEIHAADAKYAIREMSDSFGLILQDGHKQDYVPMLDRLIELLEPGGLLISDDVMFPVMSLPEQALSWQKSVAEYNELLKSCNKLRSVWLPIGDGVAISVKTEI